MSWALIPLTDQQKEIQQLARDFARSEIAPHADTWDRDAAMDPAIIRKLAELGFLGMMVPEQYDGLGLDTVTYLVALEEIAAVDASVAVAMSVHNSLPTQMILRYGSEAHEEAISAAHGASEWPVPSLSRNRTRGRCRQR